MGNIYGVSARVILVYLAHYCALTKGGILYDSQIMALESPPDTEELFEYVCQKYFEHPAVCLKPDHLLNHAIANMPSTFSHFKETNVNREREMCLNLASYLHFLHVDEVWKDVTWTVKKDKKTITLDVIECLMAYENVHVRIGITNGPKIEFENQKLRSFFLFTIEYPLIGANLDMRFCHPLDFILWNKNSKKTLAFQKIISKFRPDSSLDVIYSRYLPGIDASRKYRLNRNSKLEHYLEFKDPKNEGESKTDSITSAQRNDKMKAEDEIPIPRKTAIISPSDRTQVHSSNAGSNILNNAKHIFPENSVSGSIKTVQRNQTPITSSDSSESSDHYIIFNKPSPTNIQNTNKPSSRDTGTNNKLQPIGSTSQKNMDKPSSRDTGTNNKPQPIGSTSQKNMDNHSSRATGTNNKPQPIGSTSHKITDKPSSRDTGTNNKPQPIGSTSQKNMDNHSSRDTGTNNKPQPIGSTSQKNMDNHSSRDTGTNNKLQPIGSTSYKNTDKPSSRDTRTNSKLQSIGSTSYKNIENTCSRDTGTNSKQQPIRSTSHKSTDTHKSGSNDSKKQYIKEDSSYSVGKSSAPQAESSSSEHQTSSLRIPKKTHTSRNRSVTSESPNVHSPPSYSGDEITTNNARNVFPTNRSSKKLNKNRNPYGHSRSPSLMSADTSYFTAYSSDANSSSIISNDESISNFYKGEQKIKRAWDNNSPSISPSYTNEKPPLPVKKSLTKNKGANRDRIELRRYTISSESSSSSPNVTKLDDMNDSYWMNFRRNLDESTNQTSRFSVSEQSSSEEEPYGSKLRTYSSTVKGSMASNVPRYGESISASRSSGRPTRYNEYSYTEDTFEKGPFPTVKRPLTSRPRSFENARISVNQRENFGRHYPSRRNISFENEIRSANHRDNFRERNPSGHSQRPSISQRIKSREQYHRRQPSSSEIHRRPIGRSSRRRSLSFSDDTLESEIDEIRNLERARKIGIKDRFKIVLANVLKAFIYKCLE